MTNNLRDAIDDSVTEVKLEYSTNFPASGLVQIDSEIIKYEFSSDLYLLNCTRGFAGSVAASHLINAVVDEYVTPVVVPAYVLPAVDGTVGQVLMTDGAGTVTWQDLP